MDELIIKKKIRKTLNKSENVLANKKKAIKRLNLYFFSKKLFLFFFAKHSANRFSYHIN